MADIDDNKAQFLNEFPVWLKVLVQLGFAGLIALLFTLDSRDRSEQLRKFQEESINQSREERTMFREESKANRQELKDLRADLQVAVIEMRRAIDKLNENQILLKKQVDSIKPRD